VESVIIQPDGTWTNKDIDTDHPDAKLLNLNNGRPTIRTEDRKLSLGPPKAEIVSLDDDDEEDIGAPTPASLPPPAPRRTDVSVRASPAQAASRKRGPPQVVDLTLSDDEDEPPPRNRVEPQPNKRFRTDPPSQRSSMDLSDGVSRMNSVLNGVSPASSLRESHIRSPPSSISPRNDNNNNMFRYNQSSSIIDNQPTTFRQNNFTSTSSVPPSLPPITSTTPTLPALPSPSLTRPYLTPAFTSIETSTTAQRSPSASPVLPAFSHPKPRNSNNFRIDWDAFGERDLPNPSNGSTWEAEEDYDNDDLDLEMARLPSSMFDADGRQDEDDY
jgi:hypothetical protein